MAGGKLLLNHWYSKAEVDAMLKSPELANIQIKGYYLETDGRRFRFIHDSKTVLKDRKARTDTVHNPWGEIDPIKKRTPAQRLESLTAGIVADLMRVGTLPGADNAKMTELVGYKWVNGISVMNETVARRIAASMLTQAEKKRDEHESHFSVRPSQNDHPKPAD